MPTGRIFIVVSRYVVTAAFLVPLLAKVCTMALNDTQSSQSTLIDTHAHFIPPIFRQASLETGHGQPDGIPAIPAWDEASHLSMMDGLGISKSILSITSPGTSLTSCNISQPNHAARQLTRATNEFAADLKHRHPSRFGFWASMPLPDVEGSLLELSFALDELNADGVVLLTNHQGYYLGDRNLEPFFAELDRRGATVFVHPTAPCMLTSSHTGGCTNAAPLPQYPFPTFEFFFDTARAIINLFYTGTVFLYPNITYIFSHCGGALPPLVERFSTVPSVLPSPLYDSGVTPERVKPALASDQFYFDLAGWSFPDQLKMLLPYVSARQLLYGSDFPYTPLQGVVRLNKAVRERVEEMFPWGKEREMVFGGNAKRLLGKGRGVNGTSAGLDSPLKT